MNFEKCEFNKSDVKVFGNIISANGICPEPDKIEAIMNLPPPRNIREVRSFLGMENQLSKFIQHLADKTKPIRDLLSSKSCWTWSHVQESALKENIQYLISPPVLAFDEVNRKTKACSDASNYGNGVSFFKSRTMGFGNRLHIFLEQSPL